MLPIINFFNTFIISINTALIDNWCRLLRATITGADCLEPQWLGTQTPFTTLPASEIDTLKKITNASIINLLTIKPS